MTLFAWRDEYSVKIPSIDAQHRRLVDLLNDLHAGMLSGASRETLAPVLDGLVDYAVKHFAYEEGLFAEHGYPRAPLHIAQHQRFVEQVTTFRGKHAAREANLRMEVMVFLKDWMIQHILGSDRDYSEHMIARGVK